MVQPGERRPAPGARRQQHPPRAAADQPRGCLPVVHLVPAVAGAGRPGRPLQPQQGHAGGAAGLGGVPAHAGGEGMGGVDHRGDTPARADTRPGRRRRRSRRCAARRPGCAGLAVRPASELTTCSPGRAASASARRVALGGAAQDQHGKPCHPRAWRAASSPAMRPNTAPIGHRRAGQVAGAENVRRHDHPGGEQIFPPPARPPSPPAPRRPPSPHGR